MQLWGRDSFDLHLAVESSLLFFGFRLLAGLLFESDGVGVPNVGKQFPQCYTPLHVPPLDMQRTLLEVLYQLRLGFVELYLDDAVGAYLVLVGGAVGQSDRHQTALLHCFSLVDDNLLQEQFDRVGAFWVRAVLLD